MLGWMIYVARQKNDRSTPAATRAPRGDVLAVWQADIGGLDWLDALVEQGAAAHLGGQGYPSRYTATAKNLIPSIQAGPPHARGQWTHGDGDVLVDSSGRRLDWFDPAVITARRTRINPAVIAECSPDEWLIVEAWDES